MADSTDIGQRVRTSARGAVRRNALDIVAIEAEILAQALGGGQSTTVERAYALAYPNLAESQSFGEAYGGLESAERLGLLSGVKGKLFELRVLDDLQGSLDEGLTAHLADSPTQPGWDIAITDTEGNVVDLVQVKATDDVGAIRSAAIEHPEIDIVTTREIVEAARLPVGVHGTDVANADLVDQVESVADGALGLTPPVISFAIIVASEMADGFNADRAARRMGGAYAGATIGAGIAALTGFWWLGALGGLGVRHVLSPLLGAKETDRDAELATIELLLEDSRRESRQARADLELASEIELAALKKKMGV